MIETENFAQIEVESVRELRSWLFEHHTQSESVWLVTYKKSVPGKYVSTPEILDELLCFGWIDGLRRKLDDIRTMQLISPRRVQHWAGSYKARAEGLVSEGRMHQAGLISIEAAKRNGKWTEMDDVDSLEVPSDLTEILKSHPPAIDFFWAFAPSYQRNILRWLKLAKTSETRNKRLLQIAEFSQGNKRIPQF
jgi:uncharacterized protein YdeI (YjbR/CyaY-like superfamily)